MPEWDELLADLRSDDAEGALAAFEAIHCGADESWLPRLHELLLNGEDFFVRNAAATPIARLEGVPALPQLIRALLLGKDEGHDNDSLQAVITDVVMAAPAEAAKLLLPMLHNPFDRHRAAAAWLLGYAADVIGPEPLLAAVQDPSAEVRASAAGALGEFKGREAVFAALCRALGDADEQVRRSAAGALGDYGDVRAVPLLEPLARNLSEWTRAVVEDALKRLRTRGPSRDRKCLGASVTRTERGARARPGRMSVSFQAAFGTGARNTVALCLCKALPIAVLIGPSSSVKHVQVGGKPLQPKDFGTIKMGRRFIHRLAYGVCLRALAFPVANEAVELLEQRLIPLVRGIVCESIAHPRPLPLIRDP